MRGSAGRDDRWVMLICMRETFEYARLFIITTAGLRREDGSELPVQIVSVLSTQDGPTFETADLTLTGVLPTVNHLGQSGWMIPEVKMMPATAPELPPLIQEHLNQHFGAWGTIRTFSQQWISRRVTWPDDEGGEAL